MAGSGPNTKSEAAGGQFVERKKHTEVIRLEHDSDPRRDRDDVHRVCVIVSVEFHEFTWVEHDYLPFSQ